MKALFQFLILATVVVAVIYVITRYLEKSWARPIRQPASTVATVVGFTTVGGKRVEQAVYEYEVGGKKRQFNAYFNVSLVPGDKFAMLYDRADPENVQLLAYRPVFLQGEKVGTVAGEITRIGHLGGSYLFFGYKIAGEVYTRTFDIDPAIDKQRLVVGQKIKVIYWLFNPQRSIIDWQDDSRARKAQINLLDKK